VDVGPDVGADVVVLVDDVPFVVGADVVDADVGADVLCLVSFPCVGALVVVLFLCS